MEHRLDEHLLFAERRSLKRKKPKTHLPAKKGEDSTSIFQKTREYLVEQFKDHNDRKLGRRENGKKGGVKAQSTEKKREDGGVDCSSN